MTVNWTAYILCAVGVAILLTLLIVPQVLHVSFKKGLFDRPNDRKIHKGTIPRLGGFAFLPVLLITLGLVLAIPSAISASGVAPDFFGWLPEILVLLAAMTIMFLTGLYDDLLGVKYGVKFMAQIFAAVLMVEAGGFICEYYDLLGISSTSMIIGKLITIFLIIYIINALNLIDGIDGLAAGLCVITLCFFGVVLYLEKMFILSLISWTCAATVAVFGVFNIFGSQERHTKIFMGDIGSLTMGVLISFLIIAICDSSQAESAWMIKPIVLALSPLVIPLLDVIRVFCYRIIRHKSPFLPDKTHIHHLMMAAGLHQRPVLAILLAVQVAFLALNLWLSYSFGINVILIIDVALYAIGVISVCGIKSSAHFSETKTTHIR